MVGFGFFTFCAGDLSLSGQVPPPDYHPISYLYSITYADFSSQIRHSKVVMGKFVFLKGLADLMRKGPLSARAFLISI
jgi:hypothetical protein